MARLPTLALPIHRAAGVPCSAGDLSAVRFAATRKATIPSTVKVVAATLRRELRDEGGKPPDRPTNHQPRLSKQVIVEAHLLLQLSGKIVGDCGVCANCLDKRKFGGLGVRKRACFHKVKFRDAKATPAPAPSQPCVRSNSTEG